MKLYTGQSEDAVYYYRYDDFMYHGGVCIALSKWKVIKTTKKGVWLHDWADDRQKRFVLSDPNGKRYAYCSPEAAWKSFNRRKARQLAIYEERVNAVKQLVANCKKEPPTEDYFYIKINPIESQLFGGVAYSHCPSAGLGAAKQRAQQGVKGPSAAAP